MHQCLPSMNRWEIWYSFYYPLNYSWTGNGPLSSHGKQHQSISCGGGGTNLRPRAELSWVCLWHLKKHTKTLRLKCFSTTSGRKMLVALKLYFSIRGTGRNKWILVSVYRMMSFSFMDSYMDIYGYSISSGISALMLFFFFVDWLRHWITPFEATISGFFLGKIIVGPGPVLEKYLHT